MRFRTAWARRAASARDTDERSASDLLDVTVAKSSGRVLVTASGEVDLHTSPLLREALNDAFAGDPELVELDLSGITFLASSGLSVLVGSLEEAEQRCCTLRLTGGSRAVRRPLEIIGLWLRLGIR